MNIYEETKELVKASEPMIIQGMTANDLVAYELGVFNTLSALETILESYPDGFQG